MRVSLATGWLTTSVSCGPPDPDAGTPVVDAAIWMLSSAGF